MTKLVLDLSDPDVAAAVKGYKKGDTVTFNMVEGKITSLSDTSASVDVSEVECSETESPEEDAAEEAPMKEEMPMDKPAKKKRPAALDAISGE